MGFLSWLGVLSPVHLYTTLIFTRARRVGRDAFGNTYYESHARTGYNHTRRFVKYQGSPDPSSVPPEWHGWLHNQTDTIPQQIGTSFRRLWQKPPQPNFTGTDRSYLPAGHFLRGGHRPAASADYTPWTPEISVPEVLTKERKSLR